MFEFTVASSVFSSLISLCSFVPLYVNICHPTGSASSWPASEAVEETAEETASEEEETAGDSGAAALPAAAAGTRRAGRPTTASSWRTSPRGRPGRYVGEVGRASHLLNECHLLSTMTLQVTSAVSRLTQSNGSLKLPSDLLLPTLR